MKETDIKIIDIEKNGELKIPKSILDQLTFSPRGQFLVIPGKDFVTFKKVTKSSPRENFQEIAEGIRERAKALRINKKIVEEAVAWARKK